MDWMRILKVTFFFIVPGALLIWLIYKAMWTLSALHYAFGTKTATKLNQNNIAIAASWKASGTEFQEGYYGKIGGWVNAAPVSPLENFLYGWPLWWALPYILLSPGFYQGQFNPASVASYKWN